MTNFCGGSDAAAEQLYDELMARTWALHGVLRPATTDVSCADVRTRLAAAALSHVHGLRSGSVHLDTLRRLLWPTGSGPGIDDEWWATPLGQLMATGHAASERTAAHRTAGLVDNLVTS